MPCNRCKHNGRRRGRRRRGKDENAAAALAAEAVLTDHTCHCDEDLETENIITDKFYCCGMPESISQEFYSDPDADVLIKTCYDSSGHSHLDERRRCTFWPNFAHPRWLTCGELYNKEIDCT